MYGEIILCNFTTRIGRIVSPAFFLCCDSPTGEREPCFCFGFGDILASLLSKNW